MSQVPKRLDGNEAIKAAAVEICQVLRVTRNVPYSYAGNEYMTPEEAAEKIIRKVIRQTRQRG